MSPGAVQIMYPGVSVNEQIGTFNGALSATVVIDVTSVLSSYYVYVVPLGYGFLRFHWTICYTFNYLTVINTKCMRNYTHYCMKSYTHFNVYYHIIYCTYNHEIYVNSDTPLYIYNNCLNCIDIDIYKILGT